MAITRHPEAIQDLCDISDYLAQHSAHAAVRFLQTAQRTFLRLHRLPGLGSACNFRDPVLRGLRRRLIEGSDRYLVFYRPTDNGIEVLRVLDGRRDLTRVFGPEADDE
jgi:toxin ParE1/3/4